MAKTTIQSLGKSGMSARDEFFAQFEGLLHAVASWSKWRFAPHAREEVIQQVRSELVKAEAGLKKSPTPHKLVKTICVRRCIDEVRRQFRQRTHLVSLDAPVPEMEATGNSNGRDFPAGDEWDPVRSILRTERAALLAQLIANLDPTCQMAIGEFYAKGLSYKQIAKKLKLSINTVGSRLSKCLDKLKALIQGNRKLEEDLFDSLD